MTDSTSAPACPTLEMTQVTIGSLHQSGVTVVEGVDWKVEQGEFWAVAGHHASGKSDLLMTAAGLTAPVAGSYRLIGEPMPIFEDSRIEARLKVGLMFNGGQLLTQLTLGENITLPLRYHRDLDEAGAREMAAPITQALELSPWLDRMPGTVGRHWHQRAGLARALVMDPDLLLLDEPLSGLDVRQTAWWVNFLGDLNRGRLVFHDRPMTVVVTTDTLSPWRAVATHCAILENRVLLTMGNLQETAVRENGRVREYLSNGRWAFDPPTGI